MVPGSVSDYITDSLKGVIIQFPGYPGITIYRNYHWPQLDNIYSETLML